MALAQEFEVFPELEVLEVVAEAEGLVEEAVAGAEEPVLKLAHLCMEQNRASVLHMERDVHGP